MKRINKGGRPRKVTSAHDYGTPESIAKRAALSQGDPTLSTCPLDVMLSRKIISPEAHAAAVHFRSCRQIVFGSPHPQAVDLNQVSGKSGDYDDERAEADYRSAVSFVQSRASRLWKILENIVVHERLPGWLARDYGGDKWDQQRTCEAFATLLGWYSNRQRKAA